MSMHFLVQLVYTFIRGTRNGCVLVTDVSGIRFAHYDLHVGFVFLAKWSTVGVLLADCLRPNGRFDSGRDFRRKRALGARHGDAERCECNCLIDVSQKQQSLLYVIRCYLDP
jgi:hypothetical protein